MEWRARGRRIEERGERYAPDDVEGVQREVPDGERDEVDVGELGARGEERLHELDGDVPSVHDPAGEEGREEDDAVDPLRGAARVSGPVEESKNNPNPTTRARTQTRVVREAISEMKSKRDCMGTRTGGCSGRSCSCVTGQLGARTFAHEAGEHLRLPQEEARCKVAEEWSLEQHVRGQ